MSQKAYHIQRSLEKRLVPIQVVHMVSGGAAPDCGTPSKGPRSKGHAIWDAGICETISYSMSDVPWNIVCFDILFIYFIFVTILFSFIFKSERYNFFEMKIMTSKRNFCAIYMNGNGKNEISIKNIYMKLKVSFNKISWKYNSFRIERNVEKRSICNHYYNVMPFSVINLGFGRGCFKLTSNTP